MNPKEPRLWTFPSNSDQSFVCSTDRAHIQDDRVGAALASDLVWWAKPLSPAQLTICLDNSLCFGLYDTTTTTDWNMIGFARVITDYVTFAYLTDVYVLEEFQGKGLGRWMMRCVDETLEGWPDLRRCVLFTKGAANVRLYEEVMGMRDVNAPRGGAREDEKKKKGENGGAEGNGEGLVIMQKFGRASPYYAS
ncbi:acyl-CoA N-acyltransferase [Podospora conica]|nr:acyl-CoA N-acyltransferase [Schizothecium conicum]